MSTPRRRRETPTARRNPSGARRWVARWTDNSGKVRYAGTFDLKRDAQDAIDAAYAAEATGPARIIARDALDVACKSCRVCGRELTDRDEDGPYRADCSSLRTQWCPQWTEAREQHLMSQDADDEGR